MVERATIVVLNGNPCVILDSVVALSMLCNSYRPILRDLADI